MNIVTTCACGSVLVVLLTACGEAPSPREAPPPELAEPESPAPEVEPQATGMDAAQIDALIDGAIAREEAKSAAQYPCSLYGTADVEALLGVAMRAGDYAFVHRTENDDNWRSEACDWSAREMGGPRLSLWVSKPTHFDGGGVACFGLASDDVAEPELGRLAKWTFQKSFGWGTLRVCSDAALTEVVVMRGPKDEAAAHAIARSVASKALAG